MYSWPKKNNIINFVIELLTPHIKNSSIEIETLVYCILSNVANGKLNLSKQNKELFQNVDLSKEIEMRGILFFFT